MKRRDFLKLPALAAIPIIGVAKAKPKHSGTITGRWYHDELVWDAKHMYANGRPVATIVPTNIREAHKSAFAKWLGEQFDQAVFKALTT